VHFLKADYSLAESLFKQAHDTLLLSGMDRFDHEAMRICRNMAIAQCKRGPPMF